MRSYKTFATTVISVCAASTRRYVACCTPAQEETIIELPQNVFSYGVIGKERGVEEWEREIHAEKLRALKRTVTASETLA